MARRVGGWVTLTVASVLWVGVAPSASATEVGRVGTMKVQQYGDRGRAVILIPGLESGPWVWQRTIEDLKRNHVVYAVTLAGFDGVPAPMPDAKAGTLLDRADASLLQLIRQKHIDKPVLVGHSLGGTLALRFAGEHPRLIAGVVAVDGLPVFPFMDQLGVAQRKAMAAQATSQLAGMASAQFKGAALSYMQQIGVIDPELATRYAPLIARSDARATADYMEADMASDFRPGLKQATVPILEVMPYYAPDAKQMAEMRKMPVPTAAQKADYYRSLLVNAPNARVASIAPSRHFVMLDQPAKFEQVLQSFLQSREAQP